MSNHKFWTEERLRLAASAKTESQVRAVAEKLETSPSAVRYQGGRERSRRGEARMFRNWTVEENQRVLEAETHREIVDLCEEFGMTVKQLQARRWRLRKVEGKSKTYHSWTEEELDTLRSKPTIHDALEWAEERGLSLSVARQRYYTGPDRR